MSLTKFIEKLEDELYVIKVLKDMKQQQKLSAIIEIIKEAESMAYELDGDSSMTYRKHLNRLAQEAMGEGD